MRKKALVLVLVAVMFLGMGGISLGRANAFGQSVRVVFFGELLDGNLCAVLFEGRTYVQLSALQKHLEHDIVWDPHTSIILINSYLFNPTTVQPQRLEYRGHPCASVVINNELVASAAPAIVFEDEPYLPLRILEELGYEIGWDARSSTAYVGNLSTGELPVVGSLANLEKMFASQLNPQILYRGVLPEVVAGMPAPPAATDSMKTTSNGSDYSQTNVQVTGIDEADIVKTDGEYIYQVRNNEVIISKVYPVGEMAVVHHVSFEDEHFYPSQMFVDDKHLLVIGQSNNNRYYEEAPEIIEKRGIDDEPSVLPDLKIAPGRWWWGSPTVKAIAYDITDKAEIRLIREVELEGYMVTTRKVGSHVYLLANKGMSYVVRPMAPLFRDSAVDEEYTELDFASVRYFPERVYPNYLLVASFDLNDIGNGTIVDAYIGAGENVYMSHDSLYVAVSKHNNTTAVYKFSVDGVDIDYVAKGEVPGNILNQFSMDEHQGHFRVATTNWSGSRTTNNVYILDGGMKTVGKVEDIAPGERIYSARFMGDKGYLVTFEMVDPLFVLDLSNPTEPQILGALKIPGFSNYLHPLDEKHLLGIGKDTDVMDRKDYTGRVVSQFVIEKGMKLAIFDVSDVTNPQEKHVEIIGGRGTYSELLNNHKALLFDTRNGTLAFPVSIYEEGSDTSWGAFEFQGAVVYNVSIEDGFAQKGKITHISEQEYQKSGYRWYDGDSEVKRVLYIGDKLYVVSNKAISAHNFSDVAELNRLTIE